ncbi:MAG: alpha/beta fold hydrolase [Gemmatimonadaceae bacterium]|nr:alpha/beta fold hydrolase [Gemmatimonadaceae bacterium]
MYVEHLRIPIGSGALHVERVGRGGSPVVLLHGFATCTFLWRQLAPVLANAGYTAIAIDLLGHGESDCPDEVNYTLAAQAEYVARALAALRLPAVTIVGQDIGALVALLLAASPRSRVDSLFLLSPPDPDDLPGAEIRSLQLSSARAVLSASTLFGALPALAPLLRGGVSSPPRMSDLLVARYLAPFVGNRGLNNLLQRAAAVELSEDARAQIARVACAVCVVDGGAGTPRPSLSWPTLLPAAKVVLHRLGEVGWLIPQDAPGEVQELLLAWLDSQRNA